MIKLVPKTKLGKIRLAIILGSLLLIVTYFYSIPFYGYIFYQPQEGDILFQSLPKNDLVIAIEGATESPYSHCGVVVKRSGSWYVNEAIGPVKDTSLFVWIARGRAGKFAVYRLREKYRKYIPAFISELNQHQGKPYDIRYDLDDESIYCSELIYKAFRDASGIELGDLAKLGDLNWGPYKEIIEGIEGGNAPVERRMITPRNLSEADELEKIYSNGM